MGGAELVVVPSEWYEGLPLVILRSLAVGTPVLAADLENFSEDVVADEVGWTFGVGDVTSCTAALSQRVLDPAPARAMRPKARASYERRYSPSVDIGRLESVYRDVVADRRGK
jgi:glycosyltransferase involved in cell wall biosynthesis